MVNEREAANQIAEFLQNQVSFEEFEDWSAEFLADVYRCGADEKTRIMAQSIRAILNAFEEDETEESLRKELAYVLLPFANMSAQPRTQSATSLFPDILSAIKKQSERQYFAFGSEVREADLVA